MTRTKTFFGRRFKIIIGNAFANASALQNIPVAASAPVAHGLGYVAETWSCSSVGVSRQGHLRVRGRYGTAKSKGC